jgi:hypothetical protein
MKPNQRPKTDLTGAPGKAGKSSLDIWNSEECSEGCFTIPTGYKGICHTNKNIKMDFFSLKHNNIGTKSGGSKIYRKHLKILLVPSD